MKISAPATELYFKCNLQALLLDRKIKNVGFARMSGLSIGTIRQLIKGGSVERINRSTAKMALQSLECRFDELWTIVFCDSKAIFDTKSIEDLCFECQLKSLLTSLKMSQTQLMTKTGLSPSTVRMLTSGVKVEQIDRKTSTKILIALNCSFNDLWLIE